MSRALPPERRITLDALGRRQFLRTSVAMLGGPAFLNTLGSLFARLHAADAPFDTTPPKEEYLTGKDETVKTGEFFFPRLKFHVRDRGMDIWDVGPSGDQVLRRQLIELTNINASPEPMVVELDDLDKMSRYPYVFMTSMSEFELDPKHAQNLREFLLRGGFVHADDCCHPTTKGGIHPSDMGGNFVYKVREGSNSGIDGDRFFMDYVRTINELFPDNPMRRIPDDHEIYRCYFEFPGGCPVMQGVDHGAWGLFEQGTGRLMTVVTPGDLHCGWMSRYWAPEKNTEAIKMGINVLMYYLTH
ncbi:MAG: DUF4159 domain-containing protein [Planctomycetes bacterium]|nr:DUF4159 domain-containing protein [Planctomycetota bacterium]